MPKFDPTPVSQEAGKPEYFNHPEHGYLAYDPNTLYISNTRDGQKPINVPIKLSGKFVGTKQPMIPTCSEPTQGNAGCPKWAGCPFKKFPYVGPGNVIMRKHGTVSMSVCYDYYETTRNGRAVSQNHHGMDGWTLDTSRTTIDVLGRTKAIQEGRLNEESSRQAVMASKPQVWQMEIGDLLPPWWPLMKKKGLALPQSAELYPELADDDEAPLPKKRGRPRKNG